MKSRGRILGLLVLAFSLLIAGCSKSKEASEGESAPVTPVEVTAAKRTAIQSVISAEAVLYPLRQANVTPKISAPVARFLVQRGDHVREGQLVAILENRDLVASAQESKQLYEQAQAAYQNTAAATMPDDLTKAQTDVASTRQAMEAAQRAYSNRQALFQQGALARKLVDDANVALVQAQSQFETARQHLSSLEKVGRAEQLRGAQAQVAAAKAHYESAQAQVSYAEVRSPLAGVVSDRPLNIGEMASSGSAIVSVVDVSRAVARASIPVQQAASIRVGRPASISNGNVELKGKVTVVSPAVDPNTTTVQVWVEAPNTGERLKLGSTVRISIDAEQIPEAIVVPAAALLPSDEGGEKVMVAGTDGLAHERSVKAGIRAGDDVQILSGVSAGDQVIIQGGLGLDDKAKIRIGQGEK
jgi:multidrug efflux pump subunit AcrA (membrane-fusion protein)